MPDSVTAEIGGPDNITAQSLKPSLDLTGLDVGTHKVELKLNLPNYATLKAPVTVDVTIYERGQGTTVAPSVRVANRRLMKMTIVAMKSQRKILENFDEK